MRLELDSRVTLKAAATGKWAKDARSHGEESFAGAWKAQIKQSRGIPRAGSNGNMKLDSILVRHDFLCRQLQLEPDGEHSIPTNQGWRTTCMRRIGKIGCTQHPY